MLNVYNLNNEGVFSYSHNDYHMALIASYLSDNNMIMQLSNDKLVNDLKKDIREGEFGYHLHSYSVKIK